MSHAEKAQVDVTKVDIQAVAAPRGNRKSTWAGKLWDTFDAPPDERKLLFKLDAVLLTFASLGYFLKNIDQSNVSSAFVSGMKEDLSMYGNELTTATTCWTVGYVIGQIPSNLLLTRISPRWWIPAMELGWGVMTLATYKVTNYHALYAIRFFVGLFEAGFYPGMQFIIGGFYKPQELGKRAVIFHQAGSIGALFSSVLQAAAYTNLSGVNGLAGWRWLFIIDAIITLPLAVLGFVFLPPLPGQKAYVPTWWLSQADLDLTTKRMASINREPARPLTWARVWKMASTWHIWMMPIGYIIWNNSGNASTIMPLWLKSFNTPEHTVYTVPQINHFPMPIIGISILVAWTLAWCSDGILRGRRWPPIVLTTIIYAIACVALANIPIYKHIGVHFFLYYLTMIGVGAGGLFFTWANEICTRDNEERSLTVALMNDLAYLVQAIVPNFVWKQTDYPKSTIGLYYSFGLAVALVPWALIVRYLQRREIRQELRDGLLHVPADSSGDLSVSAGEGDSVSEKITVAWEDVKAGH